MAFPAVTLADVRRSVRIRASLDVFQNTASMYDETIDEFLRATHRVLSASFPFLRTLARVEQLLYANHPFYALPDDMTPRGIVHVLVRHQDTGEYEIHAGLHPEQINAMISNDGDNPERYRIVGQNVEIRPAPGDKYTHVIFEGYVEGFPREDTDVVSVDAEALIQATTLEVKAHYGLDVPETEMFRLQSYIRSVRGEQSLGEGFTFGSRRHAAMLDLPQRPRNTRHWANWRPW